MAARQISEAEAAEISERILNSRKYASMQIPARTVRTLIAQEAPLCRGTKETEKAVREKLHQIIAPYLGDPDYAVEELALRDAAAGGPELLRAWCRHILSIHTSSRERIPVMGSFYQQIFERIGQPRSILDLACAFDPFSFPWTGLPENTAWYAYDLHTPRVHLINSYFQAAGMRPLAEVRDILLEPPEIQAETAFFFKEAHRFEARKKGCNREFFATLPVRSIVVTLPAENLTGQHQMRDRQRGLIEKSTEGFDWKIEEFEVAGEMVFILKKDFHS